MACEGRALEGALTRLIIVSDFQFLWPAEGGSEIADSIMAFYIGLTRNCTLKQDGNSNPKTVYLQKIACWYQQFMEKTL